MARDHAKTGIVTRRELLALTTGGSVVLAGCSSGEPTGGGDVGDTNDTNDSNDSNGSGDTEETEGGSGSSDGNVVDKQYDDVTNVPPEQWQMNEFNPTQNAATNWAGNPLYDRYMRYVTETEEFEYRIISDTEWTDDTTMVAKVDNGHVWHDGDPVTAQDIATHLRLLEYQGDILWSYIEELTVADETTLEFSTTEVNQEVFELALASMRLLVKHDLYEGEHEWLTRLEDAEDESAQEEVLAELLEWRLEPEDSVGNGPFMFADRTNQSVRFDRFDDYPWADNVNFSRMGFHQIAEQSNVVQSLISGEIDGHHFQNFEEEIRNEFPPEMKRLMVTDYGGYALEINHEGNHVSDPHVRRAIAYLVNRLNIEDNITDNVAARNPCGIPQQGDLQSNILGDMVDSLEDYSYDSTDTESAAAELEEAGYSNDGDVWTSSDGEELTIDVVSPSWALMSTIAETVTSQLDRAGIGANLSVTDAANHSERYETGEYDIRIGWWALGAETPSPWFGFRRDLSEAQERDNLNFPATVEVPWPPDEQEETLEVDVEQRVSDLGAAGSDEADAIAQELAWTYNYHLPKIPITERFLTPWINTNEWETIEDQEPDTRELEVDDPAARMLSIFEWWPRLGYLRAPSE